LLGYHIVIIVHTLDLEPNWLYCIHTSNEENFPKRSSPYL
jgi:hypothetical protein